MPIRCLTGILEMAENGEGRPKDGLYLLFRVVGVAGFEPTASSSRTKRAAKLRHTPWRAQQ